MGRILFLSAVAFLAYKYIGRSNLKHLPSGAGKDAELLPQQSAPAATEPDTAGTAAPKLVTTGSRAVEPDPGI